MPRGAANGFDMVDRKRGPRNEANPQAEYALLRSPIERGPRPEVVCVEFDEIGNPLDDEHPERLAEVVMMLKKSGFAFAHVEDSNALFLRRA